MYMYYVQYRKYSNKREEQAVKIMHSFIFWAFALSQGSFQMKKKKNKNNFYMENTSKKIKEWKVLLKDNSPHLQL